MWRLIFIAAILLDRHGYASLSDAVTVTFLTVSPAEYHLTGLQLLSMHSMHEQLHLHDRAGTNKN